MKTKLILVVLATTCFFSGISQAITYTYTSPATSGTETWSSGSNWDAIPVSNLDTDLVFGGTLNAGAAIVSSNDIASPPFQLNSLTFNASGTTTAGTYTISGSQLNFLNDSGANGPTMVFNGGAVAPALTISNAILLSNDLSITATTSGTLSGVISGAGRNLAISGGGTVTLSGTSNTFGGVDSTITVSGGSTVRTTSNTTFNGFGSASNRLVLNGGGYTFAPGNSVGMSFERGIEFQNGGTNVLTNAAGNNSGRVLAIGGALTGNGGFNFVSTSGETRLLVGNNVDTTLTGVVGSMTNTGHVYVRADATGDGLGDASLNLAGGNFIFGGTSATPVVIADFDRAIQVTSATGGLNVSNNYTFTHTGTLTGSQIFRVGNQTANQGTVGGVSSVNGSGANSVVVLNGNMSGFTGGLTVSNGTLRLGSAATLPTSFGLTNLANTGGVTLDLNGRSTTLRGLAAGGGTGGVVQGNSTTTANTLTLDTTSGSQTFSGVISDGGSVALNLVKTGTNTQTLSGVNTFSGTTSITAGAGNLVVNNSLALQNSTLDYQSTGGSVTLNPAAVTLGGLSGDRALSIASKAMTIGQNNNSTTYSGVLSGTGGSLNKTGTGTMNLSNTNTYTGATTVSAGTLLISGTGSINGTSGVTVNTGGTFRYNSSTAFTSTLTLTSGATLAGSGNLGTTAISVVSGSTLSPGNSPGTQSTGTQTWFDGGNYNWQLLDATGAAGTGYDTIAITGGLDLSNLTGATDFNINLWTLSSTGPDVNGDALNFNLAGNYSWRLVSTTTGITGFDATDFTINTGAFNGTSGFSNDFTGGTFSVSVTGNDLFLDYTAVPEPSTYALMGMGLGALYLLRRKQRKNQN